MFKFNIIKREPINIYCTIFNYFDKLTVLYGRSRFNHILIITAISNISGKLTYV